VAFWCPVLRRHWLVDGPQLAHDLVDTRTVWLADSGCRKAGSATQTYRSRRQAGGGARCY
jgi:hypothetical protein